MGNRARSGAVWLDVLVVSIKLIAHFTTDRVILSLATIPCILLRLPFGVALSM
jgi:hypothetical protein